MIGKVTRGSDVGGLLRYVFGPGRHNEHTDPHIVAGWDPDAATLAPLTARGGHDLSRLTERLRETVRAAGIDGDRAVWHCSIRAAPEDPVLTDAQWAETARQVMASTGLDVGDGDGVRWVAVRHAEDHVHIVATIAGVDGRRKEPRNDYHRVAEACHTLEACLGLRSTAPADRTAGRQATRAEQEKAQRTGQPEPARAVLRREVRAAAALADSPEAFVNELRDRGVMVRLRYSTQDPEQVTGYAVAWPEDRDGTSAPAWFGGSKLAPELSWGKLSARWQPDDDVDEVPAGSWDKLAAELQGLDVSVDGSDEVLGVAATAALQRLDHGRFGRVDDDVARATRRAWGASRSLDRSHRRVLRVAGRLPKGRRHDRDAMRTMLEVVRLLQALAQHRQAQQRSAQAQAALRAATALGHATAPRQPAGVVATLPRRPRPATPDPHQRGRSR